MDCFDLPNAPDAEETCSPEGNMIRGLRWDCGRYHVYLGEWPDGVKLQVVLWWEKLPFDAIVLASALVEADRKRREWELEAEHR